MPIPRLKNYAGPALLSYGFRPFFLFGSIYAALAVWLWLPGFFGKLILPTAFALRDWHVHEMLYGYVTAVVTGFLLTAVPNWTGRLPIQGAPLLGLVAVWFAGRGAVAISAWIGWAIAALIDSAFLLLVVAAAAREIIAGRNWRNLKVLGVVGTLFCSNVAFHVEAQIWGTADYAVRLGIAAAVTLVMLVGGRIIPSFTRNWLVRENPGRLPVPFGGFDKAALAVAGLALLAWIIAPDHTMTGKSMIGAGLLHVARLARWAGGRTWRDPLVLVLRLAYAFVPLGFLLIGASALASVPATAGIHAWTAGAIGAMTLAVMSRASLGHTGRALVATAATRAVYALVLLSAIARIGASLEPRWAFALLSFAAAAWGFAFLGFAAAYWTVLTRPRLT